MTPAEHLAMAYPGITTGLPAGVADWAMGLARYRSPACLPEDLQNLAQAHFAAYLLMVRKASEAVVTDPSAPTGSIIEEREGDVTVRYADPGASSGPGAGPYAAWKALNDICGTGYGAILTRFG